MWMQNTLVPLGVFAMVVLILWLSHVTRRRAQERRAEIVRRMIEKFSTGEAFAQAIQGPAGSKLASALTLESEKPSKIWKGLFRPGFDSDVYGYRILCPGAFAGRGFPDPCCHHRGSRCRPCGVHLRHVACRRAWQ